jgi:hypothetical protein
LAVKSPNIHIMNITHIHNLVNKGAKSNTTERIFVGLQISISGIG